MFKFFINCLFLVLVGKGFCQNADTKRDKSESKDSIAYTTNYGLRIGADISKPILKTFNSSYTGFEIVADYRILKRFYIAVEFGYEEETTLEDYTNATATGNFYRVGFNYNTYQNWLDMNNEIYIGMRYGFSNFDQTLNSFTPNVIDPNNGIYFPANEITTPNTTTGLKAHWIEFVVGTKVETFKNLFFGFSFSYNIMLSVNNPENFKTMYVPGFNRVYQSNTGFGFNYTVAYIIPFFKQ